LRHVAIITWVLYKALGSGVWRRPRVHPLPKRGKPQGPVPCRLWFNFLWRFTA